MIVALDVDYREGYAVAAAVAFSDWRSDEVLGTYVRRVDGIAPYRPGSFYERELPCLLAVLDTLPQLPEIIVIDGFVTLGPAAADGLGAHLYKAVAGRASVIGVAKTPFRDTPAESAVQRPGSAKPLYVTSAGLDPSEARRLVAKMHGPHRIPTLLKAVDRLCRTAAPPVSAA